jgi:hypothetical protein
MSWVGVGSAETLKTEEEAIGYGKIYIKGLAYIGFDTMKDF